MLQVSVTFSLMLLLATSCFALSSEKFEDNERSLCITENYFKILDHRFLKPTLNNIKNVSVNQVEMLYGSPTLSRKVSTSQTSDALDAFFPYNPRRFEVSCGTGSLPVDTKVEQNLSTACFEERLVTRMDVERRRQVLMWHDRHLNGLFSLISEFPSPSLATNISFHSPAPLPYPDFALKRMRNYWTNVLVYWKLFSIAHELKCRPNGLASILHQHFPFCKLVLFRGIVLPIYARFLSLLTRDSALGDVNFSEKRHIYILRLCEHEHLLLETGAPNKHRPPLPVDFKWQVGTFHRNAHVLYGFKERQHLIPILEAPLEEYQRRVTFELFNTHFVFKMSPLEEHQVMHECWRRRIVEAILAAIHFAPVLPILSADHLKRSITIQGARDLCQDLLKICSSDEAKFFAKQQGYSERTVKEAVQSYTNILHKLSLAPS